MKSIARSIVWWPGIDGDIERMIQNCIPCQQNQKVPPPAPLHAWEWPNRPWARLHIDHAGPFLGKQFLIVVDAHSKWMESRTVSSTSTHTTIRHLRSIFATHGLPEIVVSDNATSFTSTEFQEFMTRNGIRHITSAPYHPATNGLAERAVQTFKNALKKATPGDIETALSRFLFHYRNTPHSTTGVSPAELLLGRKPRTHNTLMRPNIADKVHRSQHRNKAAHDVHARERHFKMQEKVYAKKFTNSGPVWLPGKITEVKGAHSFLITLIDGRVIRRHIENIRQRTCDESIPESNNDYDFLQPSANNPPPQVPLRRSIRNRTVPERLM